MKFHFRVASVLFLLAFPMTFVGCSSRDGFQQTDITAEDEQRMEEENNTMEEEDKRMKEAYN